MRLLTKTLFTLAALTLFAAPALASAENPISFGAQVNYADDFDLGIGVRAIMGTNNIVEDSRVVASFDWFFPDAEGAQVDITYWEINVNGHYMLPVEFEAPIDIYVGGGLNYAKISFDTDIDLGVFGSSSGSFDDSDIGLNILGGIDFPLGDSLGGFGELRIELGGGEEFVITGGVRF